MALRGTSSCPTTSSSPTTCPTATSMRVTSCWASPASGSRPCGREKFPEPRDGRGIPLRALAADHVLLAFEDDELVFLAEPRELGVQALRLRGRHVLVRAAMHDEHRRVDAV